MEDDPQQEGATLWETLKTNPNALLTASIHWRIDERFILRALEHGAHHSAALYVYGRPAALKAAGMCGASLRYHLFYKDKEVVLAALRNDPTAIQYASLELMRDKECCLLAMSSHEGAKLLHALPSAMRDDRDVVKMAVTHYGLSLWSANPRFLTDRDMVRLAMRSSKGKALMFTPLEKTDFDLVVEAIQLDPKNVNSFLAVWPGQECTLACTAVLFDPNVWTDIPRHVRLDGVVRYMAGKVEGKVVASTLSLDRLEDLSTAAALKGDEDLVAHLEHPESRLFLGKRRREYEEEFETEEGEKVEG